ncbi:hypothetical protein PF010_g11769 [Phytophthora fragariae]|uniref:Uncharacterized protein n=1 Tax=Phytophthora fragariae TaxID=53985 RepID=A0A6G0L5G8_9STRA|nr:hypothetical protein PF010_g11769 [Phytophthora fragariae]
MRASARRLSTCISPLLLAENTALVTSLSPTETIALVTLLPPTKDSAFVTPNKAVKFVTVPPLTKATKLVAPRWSQRLECFDRHVQHCWHLDQATYFARSTLKLLESSIREPQNRTALQSKHALRATSKLLPSPSSRWLSTPAAPTTPQPTSTDSSLKSRPEKANVIELDDEADDEERPVEPDFCFDVDPDESFFGDGKDVQLASNTAAGGAATEGSFGTDESVSCVQSLVQPW